MARAPADIDLKHFEKMCAYHFTEEEMAAALKISKRTLIRKIKIDPYRTLWEDGKANGRAFLKRRGFEFASAEGSAAVQAWVHMTKNLLGWNDKSAVELTGKNGGPVQVIDYSKLTDEQIDQLTAIAAALAAAGGVAAPAAGGEASKAD